MLFKTINPFTEEVISEYPCHTENQIEAFIEGLHKGYKSWNVVPLEKRLNFLLKLKLLLEEERDSLAKLITDEMGKPIKQSISEIEKSILLCDYYYQHSEGFLSQVTIKTSYSKSYYQYSPTGIIFGIMPWNFPLWQVMRFAIPNLVLGNAILLKHAPNTTGVSLAIEKIFSKALSLHLFKSIIIDVSIVPKVLKSNFISGVSVTGGKKAGSSVAQHAGANIKKVVLELGGNDPFIVFDDANIEDAVCQCIESRLLNAGQVCIAAKRIILSKNIARQFEDLLLEKLQNFRVGSPYFNSTQIGPLAKSDIKSNLNLQVNKALNDGAVSIYKSQLSHSSRYFFPITVLKNVQPSNVAFKEELFGPVFSITEAANNKQAIVLANQSDYGLAASIFTKDLKEAEQICKNELEVGMCAINKTPSSNPELPFGGIKSSGFGRELAEFGLKEFSNIKTIVI